MFDLNCHLDYDLTIYEAFKDTLKPFPAVSGREQYSMLINSEPIKEFR